MAKEPKNHGKGWTHADGKHLNSSRREHADARDGMESRAHARGSSDASQEVFSLANFSKGGRRSSLSR